MEITPTNTSKFEESSLVLSPSGSISFRVSNNPAELNLTFRHYRPGGTRNVDCSASGTTMNAQVARRSEVVSLLVRVELRALVPRSEQSSRAGDASPIAFQDSRFKVVS